MRCKGPQVRILCIQGNGDPMATQPQNDPDLETVFDTPQESEALVVHGLLESAGIESVIYNREAPDVFPVGGVAIKVNPEQAEEARRIIEEYRNNAAADEAELASEGESTPDDSA